TDLTKLLETTRDLVRCSLNIEVVIEAETPGSDEAWMALADANQLQQVLVNLSLNALDAMPKPQPAPVGYRLCHRLFIGELPALPQNIPPGDYLVVEVRDRGRGMTPEVMSQALDPFFTTKDIGQGTGLGLPVAFGIMSGHQGFLTITSEAGQGTSIGLYFPRLRRSAPDPVASNVTVLEPEVSPQRHILVVDDEQAVRDVICRFLGIAGHDVVGAANGQAALRCLQDHPVDLVVLDWLIPNEEGRTNFNLIRQARPGIPILLCTGLVHAEQAAEMLGEGAVDLLRKPFRMNQLWHAVNNSLQGTSLP